jgi:spermidine synthase
LVTQATSPFFARRAFWCIVDSIDGLEAGGPGGPRLRARPYRATVPSFGPWGFALASARPVKENSLHVPIATRYITTGTMARLFSIPPDEAKNGQRCINRLNNAVLARVYRRGWSRFGE